ncbi:MAG: efflux RND transporter permease subunit [Proteobacteria bacterium]|nr:efflux RND transporter permease subunit [Pseudomonadota bacterium]
MKLTEYALEKKTFAYVMAFCFLVGGLFAYKNLGRLEFPAFTIKTALVITSYPGASPAEVEQEVTEPIESAIQQLGQVKEIRSISRAGLSIIFVDVKNQYDSARIPQIWDELRRKVGDIQMRLPPGAGPSLVNDDFGDEYGVFFAVYGDGFSYRELKDYAKLLRRELLLVRDVASVEIYGDQPETVYLEISRARLAELGGCVQNVVATLNNQSQVADGGRVQVGGDYIRVLPTGGFTTLEDMENLIVHCGPQGGEIHLKDVARIRRGYLEPPQCLMMYNGKPALGLGIATTSDGNVVTMGEAVKKRISELSQLAPTGMEMGVIAFQSETVTRSLRGFVVNFAEALAIVFLVLFAAMGLASGMLMGVILVLTILGTFLGMRWMGISLQIISLGALVLALGMLVDNAIVVTEGILVRVKSGVPRRQAALETCAKTAWPLLGATAVAIMAFAAIGTSQDVTGEFLGSLFKVMAISLGLSWVLALTLTPLFCVQFLPSAKGFVKNDPYSGRIFRKYRWFLDQCLRRRLVTLAVLAAVVVLAVLGFGRTKMSFFPASDRPQFMVDFWRPEGAHIQETSRDLERIAEYIQGLEGVTATSTFVGRGALRFILTYNPEQPNPAYGQVLATVDDFRKIKKILPDLENHLRENFPDAEYKLKEFFYGPPVGARIEARFSGPDPKVLRNLSEQARAIMAQDPDAIIIRDNWRQPVETILPVISEGAARRTGVTRPDVARAIQASFTGRTVGLYREGEDLLPVILRLPGDERDRVEDLQDVQVFAPAAGKPVPLGQVVTELATSWENPIIWRYDRKPTISVWCDPGDGDANGLFSRLRPRIEALEMAPGYQLEWGGEYEKQVEANTGLFSMVPMFFLLMVLTILGMFNSLRQTLIIFLTLPLAIVGVTGAFLLTGKPFDFNCTLGFLGLSGMLIKNAVVLIDQINQDIQTGKRRHTAILDSSVSRLRPVCMASVTTIFGMFPLLPDPFFGAMSLTIIGGLAFGTVLTLIIVPVLFALFYRVRPLAAQSGEREEPS